MTEEEQFHNEIEWRKWESSYKLFVLLDCAQLAKEQIQFFQSLDSSKCVGLFRGTPDEGLKDVEPLLLDPIDLGRKLGKAWLIENEKLKPMLIWLVSDMPLEKLARNVRALLSADLPGAPNALLRFYDPRVFKKLMYVLDEEQKSLFFAQVRQWSVWAAPDGMRINYAAPKDRGKSVDKIVLSASQMHVFNQIDFDEFVRATKEGMIRSKDAHLHTKNLGAAEVGRLVEEHINKAIEFGFESEEAIAEYLYNVVAYLGWGYVDNDNDHVKSALQDEYLTEDEKLAYMKKACANVFA